MKASLSQGGVELDERDFFQDQFTEQELRELLGDTPASAIFSYRSPSVKKMELKPDELSEDDLIRLMLEEPRLVRRPLIKVGNRVVVGTDKKAMAEVFPD
ncbi:MAG: hypothetical protein O2821_00610 [Chloroflexi bacterium]|nr:hypothetical protein [Chloroflexota bacterium]MDA1226595.1 hypothetical protein [Chloroflexota bacterium]